MAERATMTATQINMRWWQADLFYERLRTEVGSRFILPIAYRCFQLVEIYCERNFYEEWVTTA